jgi:D-glycerate 3-kinase
MILQRFVDTFDSSEEFESRGLPGTHDVNLVIKVLNDLKHRRTTRIPQFDKLLCNGKGDRLETYREVDGSQLDVVIIEGWFLGFPHLPSITDRINTQLKDYEQIYEYFDAFIQLKCPDYRLAYRWRQEQETQSSNAENRQGMNEDQVRKFVDKFIPCYEKYLDNIRDFEQTLVIEIDKERKFVKKLTMYKK